MKQTVERIRTSVAYDPITIEAGKVFCTMSFGAINYGDDASIIVETLIKLADETLYKAKKAGRNRVKIGTLGN